MIDAAFSLPPVRKPVESIIRRPCSTKVRDTCAIARPDTIWQVGTPRGEQLEDQIRGPWYWHGSPKTLHINCDRNDAGEVGGSNLWIDPNYHPQLDMNIGPAPASLEWAIAHELGHTLGTRDDGPGKMNNVNLNENPISTQLGEPYYRIRY
jgi:hypothetical protein